MSMEEGTKARGHEGTEWVDLCAADEVSADAGHYVVRDDHGYAILRDEDGKVHVMDNACPHAGASMAAGYIEDGCAVCTWHAWPFEVGSGECPDNRTILLKMYETRESDGRVRARLNPLPLGEGGEERAG